MATLTLRPNGAGNQNGWNAEGGDYTRVDESSSDGDTTRLYSPTNNVVSTFAMGNHGSETGTISSVEVFINTRGLDPISNVVQLAVRSGGTDYFSGNQTYNNTSYHEESYSWTTNPDTSSAWTWSEIDSMEAGMKRISGGGQAVTQVWAVVTYTAGSIEQEGFRFRDDDGSETAATWAAAQDTHVTEPDSTNLRLRLLLNTTNAAGAINYQLEFKEKVSGSYAIVPVTLGYTDNMFTGGTSSALGDNDPNEGDEEAFDDNDNTKWLHFTGSATWLKYDLGSGNDVALTKYEVTSGNDDDTRDPKDWTFQGSDNDSDWDDLDTVTGETFASRKLTKSYTFTNTTAYRYYRFYIDANNGSASITQLSEIRGYADETSDIIMAASANITASGADTTVQLTSPSGKTTSDFDAGRIQDDENPADAVTCDSDDYTEMEWCLEASEDADGNTYQFRVTNSGAVLDTYTVTPEWTVGTAGGVVFVPKVIFID